MISANEARANVAAHEQAIFNNVAIIADELLDTMSNSIEFHSQNGFESAEFMPYRDSRFSTDYMMKTASEIFERVFTENGYDVLINDWKNNRLKIAW